MPSDHPPATMYPPATDCRLLPDSLREGARLVRMDGKTEDVSAEHMLWKPKDKTETNGGSNRLYVYAFKYEDAGDLSLDSD